MCDAEGIAAVAKKSPWGPVTIAVVWAPSMNKTGQPKGNPHHRQSFSAFLFYDKINLFPYCLCIVIIINIITFVTLS